MDEHAYSETGLQALQSARAAHHRLDRLEEDVKDIHTLAQAMAATRVEMRDLKDDMSDVKKNVSRLTAQPGSRWDRLVNAAVSAVSTGLVGALFVLILR
ncbi:MAG: hypothetical protein LKF71_02375 [Oscillospiraceae bacterium]|jgi:ubiquinone biosynthesis protein UbiJ|nr:hypothetical protein [Oscillospiraceae bacterium]